MDPAVFTDVVPPRELPEFAGPVAGDPEDLEVMRTGRQHHPPFGSRWLVDGQGFGDPSRLGLVPLGIDHVDPEFVVSSRQPGGLSVCFELVTVVEILLGSGNDCRRCGHLGHRAVVGLVPTGVFARVAAATGL